MEHGKVKGIVCKLVDYKESDRILTLLTFEKGKMSVVAKGVKKKGAVLSHAARLFYCGNFEYVEKSGFPILTGASQIQDLFGLTASIEILYYASHFIDVCSCFIQEQQPAHDIMSLLLNSLYLLAKNETDPMLLAAILQFRLACLEGQAPVTDFCVECNSPLDEHCSFCFSIENDGISCCNTESCITHPIYESIRHICTADASKIFFFNIPKSDLAGLFELSCRYVEKIAGKHFDILDKIKKL